MNSLSLVEPAAPQRLRAASWPRSDRAAQRLLVVDTRDGSLSDRKLRDLPELLDPGDLLVVNDAATLPAALEAVTEAGERMELRLVREHRGVFWALGFGAGDWRMRTEDRSPAPSLAPGARLSFAAPGNAATATSLLTARVVPVQSLVPSIRARLVGLAFDQSGARLWDALYRVGRPIQYSHLQGPLELWHVQNVFAARPWAFELPSAAQGFDWPLIGALRQRRIELATLTHSAGISSTGSAALDRLLPLPERYEIPRATVHAVERTRRRGGRILAIGTSVVRALESAALPGRLIAGQGEATLVLGPPRASHLSVGRARVARSVLSGIHQPGDSHHALLQAFAPDWLLARASAHARAHGYLTHEFGDACLVLGEESAALRGT